MPVHINRKNDPHFTEILEQAKQMQGTKSSAKAAEEAVRYYVNNRPKDKVEIQALKRGLSDKTNQLKELVLLLKQRSDSEKQLTKFFMDFNKSDSVNYYEDDTEDMIRDLELEQMLE